MGKGGAEEKGCQRQGGSKRTQTPVPFPPSLFLPSLDASCHRCCVLEPSTPWSPEIYLETSSCPASPHVFGQASFCPGNLAFGKGMRRWWELCRLLGRWSAEFLSVLSLQHHVNIRSLSNGLGTARRLGEAKRGQSGHPRQEATSCGVPPPLSLHEPFLWLYVLLQPRVPLLFGTCLSHPFRELWEGHMAVSARDLLRP